MSPGINIFWPVKLLPDFITIFLPNSPLIFMSAPNALSILSVWSLEDAGSITEVVPEALNPANNIADLTWALATGVPITQPF